MKSSDKLNLKKSSHPTTSYMESQEGELYNLLISCHNNIVITDNYDLIPSSRKSCRSLTSKWQKVWSRSSSTMNEPQNGRTPFCLVQGDSCLIKLQGNRFWWQRAQGLFWAVIADKLFIIERQWSGQRAPTRFATKSFGVSNFSCQRSEFTVNIVSKNFLLLLKSA